MRDQRLNTTICCITSSMCIDRSTMGVALVGVYTCVRGSEPAPVMFVHLTRNSSLEDENTRMEASSREQFVEYLERQVPWLLFKTLVRACTNQIFFSMKPKEVIEVRNILELCC